jgi:hypothetical protein
MALSLGTGFSGVALPVTIAVEDFVILVAKFIEQGEGFGSALDGAGFSAVRALRHLVASDDLQELDDELLRVASASMRGP